MFHNFTIEHITATRGFVILLSHKVEEIARKHPIQPRNFCRKGFNDFPLLPVKKCIDCYTQVC